jgi:predicted polyphosphate/ATP-dependent NAD kinase
MGGRVGLKGTDGEETLRQAIALGAKAVAPARATEALRALVTVKDVIRLVTYPNEMGEDEAEACGFNPKVIGSAMPQETTSVDTKRAVKEMINLKVDLILFVGGDGTARDVYEAAREKVPVLGVPAGVTIHSAVFAVSPQAAAVTAARYLFGEAHLREMEVMDIDEEAFRSGRVSARLYGYLLVPYEPDLIQGTKISSPVTELEIRNQAAIAIHIIEDMNSDEFYVIGPGTTTRTIGDLLDERKTLLGVDIFYNKKIIAKDVDETTILREIRDKKARIIVTPIGGQGFIFGRGNLQISPKVIREVGSDKILVIATKNKLKGLKRSLRVDTGDPELDDELRGYMKVITDYGKEQVIRVD